MNLTSKLEIPISIVRIKRVENMRFVLVTGFFAALAYHLIQSELLFYGYPRNTFLFMPKDSGMDYFNIIYGCADRDPYEPSRINYIGGYFPFAYFVGHVLSLIEPTSLGLAVISIAFVVLLAWNNLHHANCGQSSFNRTLNALAFTACAYPVIFVLDRGNFDMIIFVFVWGFWWCYERDQKMLGVLFLALATAMKGYTGIFLLLLLADKRYRESAVFCLLVAFLTTVSLACFSGGFTANWDKFRIASSGAFDIGVAQGATLLFSSSLFSALFVAGKLIGISINKSSSFLAAYTVFVLAMTGYLFFYLSRRDCSRWQKWTLLVLAMILFPYSSGDYRLIFLFIPIWMFLSHARATRHEFWYAVLFALLLTPKAYFHFPASIFGRADLNINMIINPVCLLVLFALLIEEANSERTTSHPPTHDALLRENAP